jgi:uncharacterized protein YraI
MTPAITPPPGTSTLPSSAAPLPSTTPLPPPAEPTSVPIDGITSTQINVRLEPSTASDVLGVIPADMRVEITGKDPGGRWWQIIYPHPQAVDGKGWVTAEFVELPSAVEVPVVGGTGTDSPNGSIALVQQQINVRSGPGTGFNSLGTLNPEDVVSLTGKDPNGAWLQIEFAAGPEGKGWINAAFVQAQGAENLPIVAESGTVIGTGTPTGIPPTPTPTLIPAWEDGDSPGSPSTSVTFAPNGTQAFMYNGDVSFPQGDHEDWILFKPSDTSVFIRLECTGNEAIEVQISENGLPANTYIECGAALQEVAVSPGSNYLLHVQSDPSATILQYTKYTLTIKLRP